MSPFKRSLFFIFSVFVLFFGLTSPTSASVDYSRSPSGTTITSPVSISYSFDFGEIADMEEMAWYELDVWSVEGEGYASGECLATTTTSGSYAFTLPAGNYAQVGLALFSSNTEPEPSCNEGTFARSYMLEGVDGSSDTIFSIVDPTSIHISKPTEHKPEVEILSPQKGSFFSTKGLIEYKATDANDNDGTKSRYGLTDNPVSIFYTDKVAEWNGFVIPNENKTLIKKDLPAIGSYVWDLEGFSEGKFYRIIVDAIDAFGEKGEMVSDFFGVDFTAPTFIVKTDPPVTHGNDVTVSVDASENLMKQPTITVTQAGGESKSLSLKGQGSHYEGIYTIQKGYDGVATIAVSGSDIAGNVGTNIVSGGTFAVGINPPPAPRIISPRTNLVIGTSTISVSGTVRADTSIVIVVNGIDTYMASSSPNGAFTIANIRLSKEINHGLNILNVAARDQTGLMSEAVPIQVKYNIAPTVAITSPTDNAIITAETPLVVRAGDENTDSLLFTYQIISAQDFTTATSTDSYWDTIGDAIQSVSFSWDSTEAEDGQYFMRVIADDGFAKTYSAAVPFSIHNTLSFFRFEDGRKTITKSSTVTIVGQAITPDSVSPRPTVSTVDYSLDNGRTWKSVSPTSGKDTPEAHFSVKLTGLAEGTLRMLWRVRDSRKFYGRTSHSVIVDTISPDAPIVNYPTNNAFVTNENDENASQDGLQISISGTAESQSMVTLQSGSTTMNTRAGISGAFSFLSVSIPYRGANQFKVTATDEALNASAASVVNVIYDNPPSVSILSPKPFRGLTGKTNVSWSVSDADNDPIQQITLGYRRGKQAFTPIAISPTKNSTTFDVSNFPEASDYQLRLSASDGMATSSDVVNFSVDRMSPVLSSFVLNKSVLKKNDVLLAEGTAQDDLSGIEYVEYAVTQDKPKSFSTALITSGFLQNNATFSIKYPATLPDGTYNVYARAVDAAGNVSPVLSRSLAVDTSAPRIGSFDVLTQGTRIAPDAQGAISLYKNMHALFEVSLEGDTDTASLSVGTTTVSLKKDIASGLWQTTVDSGNMETTAISISAEDNTHNAFINIPLGSFHTINYGSVTAPLSDGSTQPLSGVVIKVLILDEETGNFAPLSSSTVTSDAEGKYVLALPQGTYKISANKDGYKSAVQNVTLEHASFVNASFEVEKYSGIWGYIRSIIDRIFSK